MKEHHLFIIVLILAIQKTVNGMNLYVDASITTQSGNSYPTLLQAVQAIINPSASNTLLNATNTITLMNNTNGTTQTLPNVYLNQAHRGISIIFENPPPAMNSLADCTLLPTLSLSSTSNSRLNIVGLDYFFIQGMNIQILADSTNIEFASTGNVTFDSFCFVSNDFNSNSGQIISFNSITNLILSNFIGNWQSQAQISINFCSSPILQNIKFIAPNPLSVPIFYFSGGQEILVKNFWSNCSNTLQKANSLLAFFNSYSVLMQFIEIQDCNFYNGYTISPVYFSGVTNVTVQYLTFKNIIATIALSNYLRLIRYENPHYALFEHFYIYNISSEANTETGGFDFLYSGVYSGNLIASFVLRNITFEDLTVYGKDGLINIFTYDNTLPQNIFYENVTVLNCNFTAAALFIFKVPSYSTRQSITTTTPYYISNLNILGSYFNTTVALAFLNSCGDLTAYLIDMYRIEISNLVLQNNIFTSSGAVNVMEIIGSQIRLSNATLTNNTFITCSFLVTTLRISTLIFLNSTIEGLYLKNGAIFLNYAQSQTTYFKPESSFYGVGVYFLEERPFIMINCSLNNLSLESTSTLIWSDNPTILLINNTFTQIYSTSSTILDFGVYEPPAPKVSGIEFAVSSTAQNAIFSNIPTIQILFDSVRSLMSSYEYSDPTAFFFIYLESIGSVKRMETLYFTLVFDHH